MYQTNTGYLTIFTKLPSLTILKYVWKQLRTSIKRSNSLKMHSVITAAFKETWNNMKLKYLIKLTLEMHSEEAGTEKIKQNEINFSNEKRRHVDNFLLLATSICERNYITKRHVQWINVKFYFLCWFLFYFLRRLLQAVEL